MASTSRSQTTNENKTTTSKLRIANKEIAVITTTVGQATASRSHVIIRDATTSSLTVTTPAQTRDIAEMLKAIIRKDRINKTEKIIVSYHQLLHRKKKAELRNSSKRYSVSRNKTKSPSTPTGWKGICIYNKVQKGKRHQNK